MKKILFIAIFVLLSLTQAWAYDFSAVCSTGQTLYYIISGSNVTVTNANNSYPDYYYGYTKPTGNLVIPSQVTYADTTYSVTSIGSFAFSGCTGLTSVTIPNSVTSIDRRAFEACTGLASVTISSSVTIIGNWAFYRCTGLTSVNYTGTLAQWCNITFNSDFSNPVYYAHNLNIGGRLLTNAVVPSSMRTINPYAFCGCSSLTSVTIPNSVRSIGTCAFWSCKGLTSVAIPNSVTSIGPGAFENCTGLTSVTIGNSVRSIGSFAFSGCTGLTSVTIPNSATTIGTDAFSQVRNIVYYGTATGSPWGALSLNGYVEYPLVFSDSTKTTLLGCAGTATSVTIPNSVTSIGNYAFKDCTGLTSVTIGDSVTSIGDGAFFGCICLTSVTIPNSATTIGTDAFSQVRNIVYYGTATGSPWGALSLNGYVEYPLVFSDSTKTTLLGCTSTATSVTIPNSVTSIGNYAFKDCTGLTSVTIGDSVTSIGSSAFSGCSSLTSVTIPSSVTSIGEYAFYRCTGLTSVTIPNSVTSIGEYAFFVCSGLNSVTIGDSVTSIGEYAFYRCTGLTSVTIPNSVTSIGEYAFEGCTGLTSVTIGNSVTSIDHCAFRNCTGLTSVTIPNSVTSIGEYAFYVCYGLTSVTIGDSVTSIGYSAFSVCYGLTSVTIGNSVTFIDEWAFKGCLSIDTIISKSHTAPSLGTDAFDEVSSTIPVFVPCGSSTSYNTRWSSFSNIVEDFQYSFAVSSSAETQGTVTVLTTPTCTAPNAVFSATANAGYAFHHWSDGNTDNPRTLTLTQDTALLAYFISADSVLDSLIVHDTVYDCHNQQLVILVNNDTLGACAGAGSYPLGSTVQIMAIPRQGTRFLCWSDGNIRNPRTVVLTGDLTFTAIFEQREE